MNGRSFAFTAVAAVLIATPAAGQERTPVQPQPIAQPGPERAPTVLASADMKLPAQLKPQADEPAPAKRPRAARVTTCRCGDPSAQ